MTSHLDREQISRQLWKRYNTDLSFVFVLNSSANTSHTQARLQAEEGIVVVMDVGPGVRAGVNETFFSLSKKCVINILQRKMFAEKCVDQVGIVLFGSDDTDNALAGPGQYQNIKVLQDPRMVSWDLIDKVESLTGGRKSGDWLDALVVAMDLLHDPDGIRFKEKKIALFTDFSGEFSDDQTKQIIAGLQNHGIYLNVIGPEIFEDDENDKENGDNDDDAPGPSNGAKPFKNGLKSIPQNWNGKPKTHIQLAGEALVTAIIAEANGGAYDFDAAISQLVFFEKQSSNSGNWNALLDIGPNFQIAITGRIKIKHATAPSWKTAYAQDESAVIIKETSYHRNDDAQTPVDEADVIPGYKYGTTLVPFSDEDNQMKYSSDNPRSMSILGFSRRSSVPLHLRSGEQVLVVTAREGDEAGAVALSSFIQALVELDYVGITRRIYNKNNDPTLGVLYPEFKEDYECLIWIPLPFQEDVRSYTFPSLKKTIEKLTDSEIQAMDNLITFMSLIVDEDDEDEKRDLMEPREVLNPQLQHYYNALTHRALHEFEPVPAPPEHVLKILMPPEEVIEGMQENIQKVASAFPTKKIIKKTKRDKENLMDSKEEETNKRPKLEDGDDDEAISANDLTIATATKVTTATPVEDFYALLKGEAPNFTLICNQMGDVILQLMDSWGGSSSAGETLLSRILDCLTAFRKESCIIDPSPYNKFLPRLKDFVTLRALNQFWDRLKEGNLGLLTSEESVKSSVDAEAAATFLKLEEDSSQAAPEPKQEEEDFEDLLDDL